MERKERKEKVALKRKRNEGKREKEEREDGEREDGHIERWRDRVREGGEREESILHDFKVH
jgi:hypothetical protein